MTRLADLGPTAAPRRPAVPADYFTPSGTSQAELVDFPDEALCDCGRALGGHELHDHPFTPAAGELADPIAEGWTPC